jgi:hypothetical protein
LKDATNTFCETPGFKSSSLLFLSSNRCCMKGVEEREGTGEEEGGEEE